MEEEKERQAETDRHIIKPFVPVVVTNFNPSLASTYVAPSEVKRDLDNISELNNEDSFRSDKIHLNDMGPITQHKEVTLTKRTHYLD